jgi:carbonic anhydrase/acetyltransferase-like protein (isoleucine patch superfamily)
MSGLILPYRGVLPRIAAEAFVAPTAVVVGDVEIGADTGIWFGCVIRGDVNAIRIGERTNIQDGTIVHVSSRANPTYIGSDVTIGHGAIIHACMLEDGGFVGMGATVMDGAVVATGAMVAAGALVPPGTVVTAGRLWAGIPAKPIRDLTEADREVIAHTVPHYVELARRYRADIG